MIFKQPQPVIISSEHLKDEDISQLWEILGRIADNPNNSVDPSQDAEIFIGYYEWIILHTIQCSVMSIKLTM